MAIEEKKNNKKRNVIIAVILIIIAIIVVILIILLSNKPDDTYKIIQADETDVIEIPVQTTVTEPVPEITTVITENTVSSVADNVRSSDLTPVDMSFPDEIQKTYYGLSNDLMNFSVDALTFHIDDITLQPGKLVKNTLSKNWVCEQLDDVMNPNDATFIIAYNRNYTAEKYMFNVNNTDYPNGQVILWVKNYTGRRIKVNEAVVYKYQVSFENMFDLYREHPKTDYYGYHIGSLELADNMDVVKVYDNDINSFDASDGKTYVFGNIDNAEALLYMSNTRGLQSVTVTYNPFYGPDFRLTKGVTGTNG